MSYTVQERINAVAKALMGGVLDSDPSAQWYESTMPFSFVLNNNQVWSEGNTVKANPAANVAAARANCAGPLAGIVDDLSLAADAVRLTPVPGVNNTFVALSVYGDFTSVHLDNFIKPQFAPQASGTPSFGYAVRLFDGDPAGAGVEVMTTDGTTGVGPLKSVGWVFNYDNGLLLLSSDFPVADPYVMGFRYIGLNPAAAATGNISTIVWAPGTPFGGSVVNTWGQLMALFATIKGKVVVQVDARGGALTIPAGAYELDSRMEFSAAYEDALASDNTISMADGAVLKNLFGLRGAVRLEGNNTALNALVFDKAWLQLLFVRDAAEIINNGTVVMCAVAAAATMMLGLDQEGKLLNGVTPVIDVAATGTSVVAAYTGASIANQAISGAVGALLTVKHDASVSIVAYPLFLGTRTDTMLDQANYLAYDDAKVIPNLNKLTAQDMIDELKLGGPRMTTVDRLAIVAPTPGLRVYDTTLNQLFYWDSTSWVQLGAAGAAIAVYDEGVLISGAVSAINFIGADVMAQLPGAPPGQVNVYVPPPPFLSHWNTADGSNGDQSCTESIVRAVAHIATPNGGEGTPFKTNGWAATNQSATLNGMVTITTPGDTSGFGGTSTVTAVLYDADGVSVLETYTTPAITGNAVHTSPSGFIVITITNYGADAFRFKAHASVAINALAILAAGGLTGGRVHAKVTHTTDAGTDGSGPYVYTQTEVFLDTNPATPSIATSVSMDETVGSIVTKHLSGLEYYILTSQFTVDVLGVDDLNANTSKTAGNLNLTGTEFGVGTLALCPFGTGAANFIGWTNDDNNTGVQYLQTNWAISAPSYRYVGPTCNISGYPADTWANGGTVNSVDHLVLIDTYVADSTALAEYFDDESRREDPATFPGVGTWVSTNALIAGQAMVFGSYLIAPNQTYYIRSDGAATPNADWSLYKPDLGGANPDYSAIGVPVNYGRRFTKAPGASIPSMSIVFSGTFAAGNALADLVAGNLEIYVYRIAGLGHIGPPPGNTFPLRVHEPFNFGSWDDGVTVPGSGIREGSSVGNTINCTFGTGTPADTGFYCEVKILNAGTKIDSMVVTFF